MKKNEKKLIFIISFSILLIIDIIFFYSNYARYVNYNEILGIPVMDLGTIKFYIPTSEWGDFMDATPNAYHKAKSILFWSLFDLILPFFIFYKPKPLTSHGSARWGTLEDLKEFDKIPKFIKNYIKRIEKSHTLSKEIKEKKIREINNFIVPLFYTKSQRKRKIFELNLLQTEGLVIGEFEGITLRDDGPTHFYLSAPTRTGKGVSIILTSLILWKESVVVLDIKGENYQKTSGYRKKVHNSYILRYAPMKDDSCSFNPLEEINFTTNREYDDVKRITNLITEEKDAKDPFWQLTSSTLMASIILYVYYKNRKVSLGDVLDFLNDPSGPLKNRILDIKGYINLDGEEIHGEQILTKEDKNALRKLYENPADLDSIEKGMHPRVARGFASILQASDATRDSIVKSAEAKLEIYGVPTVRKNTSSCDFKINDLVNRDKPVSLYLVMEPEDKKDLGPLFKIITVQIIGKLTKELSFDKEGKQKKHKHKLLMALDEFPALGKVDAILDGIGFVATYGIKLMIITQSDSQLYDIYGKEGALSIMSNCELQIYYTPNDQNTAEAISKTLGKETIRILTKSGNFGKKNTSEQYIGRDLLTPTEVRTFPKDKMIVIVGGKPPIIVEKILSFEDKRFTNPLALPAAPTDKLVKKR